eukprot:jgi/Chlat1/5631/Chrsp369S05392
MGRTRLSDPPATYDLARVLSANRARKQQQLQAVSDANHQLSLQRLQERIAGLSSVSQRKKNQWDAQLYPVYLRRDPTATSANDDHPPPASTTSSRPSSARPRHQNFAQVQKRPQSARSTRDIAAARNDVLVVETRNPYKDFKASMIDRIVEEKLYTSEQLEALFALYKEINGPEHQMLLNRVIDDVRAELLLT